VHVVMGKCIICPDLGVSWLCVMKWLRNVINKVLEPDGFFISFS
jgi:hypothetical protein